MPYAVRLSADAEHDLEDIYRYVRATDGRARADVLLDQLEACCMDLADLPMRGHVPRELGELGITEYRQILSGPYRVLYRIMGEQVMVYAVLDGRRDMQTLLVQRLMR